MTKFVSIATFLAFCFISVGCLARTTGPTSVGFLQNATGYDITRVELTPFKSNNTIVLYPSEYVPSGSDSSVWRNGAGILFKEGNNLLRLEDNYQVRIVLDGAEEFTFAASAKDFGAGILRSPK